MVDKQAMDNFGMVLKQFCEKAAREQFATKKLDSANERLELIKVLIEKLEKAQHDISTMTELLHDLERYEIKEDQKIDNMLVDMEQREGWK